MCRVRSVTSCLAKQGQRALTLVFGDADCSDLLTSASTLDTSALFALQSGRHVSSSALSCFASPACMTVLVAAREMDMTHAPERRSTCRGTPACSSVRNCGRNLVHAA